MELLRFLEVSVPGGGRRADRGLGVEALGSTWERAGKQVRSPTRPLVSGQSLPEEEQQRVLGEEKMLSINKKQATSPASKKPSQEGGKVRKGQTAWGWGWGRWGSCQHPHGPDLLCPPTGGLGEAQAARVSHVHLL